MNKPIIQPESSFVVRQRTPNMVIADSGFLLEGYQMAYNKMENNPSWRGGKTKDPKGRILILFHNHPRANHNNYVLEHLLVIEKALGRPIKRSEEVHHINGIQNDNRNTNLVLCQDHAYHMFLHRRKKALASCGNKSCEPCKECGKYNDPTTMTLHHKLKHRNIYIHKECNRKLSAKWRKNHPTYWKQYYKYERR